MVSAAVVALALVADSTDFGTGFHVFALLIIPVLVIIAPELEKYFVTGHGEDVAGVMRTYGARRTRVPATQYLSSIALLVSVIVAVLVGALAGVVGGALESPLVVSLVVGLVAGLAALALVVLLVVRHVRRTWARRT